MSSGLFRRVGWRRIIIGGSAFVLCLGLALQYTKRYADSYQYMRRVRWLAHEIPSTLANWSVSDVPLGQNEASSSNAEEILRFDDVVFRRYAQNASEFSVYIAYWAAGKMPNRLVAEHTPDRCWIENGWKCDERMSGIQYVVRGRSLPSAEWRRFSPPSHKYAKQDVIFWLIVDGAPYQFNEHQGILTHAWTWWRGVIRERVGAGYGEKLFIRISSSQSYEQLWNDEGFQTVMAKVAILCSSPDRNNSVQ